MTPRRRILILCLIPLAIAGAAWPRPARPLILHNLTPSVPLGFYYRCDDTPAPGRLVAFPAPASVHAYVAAHLPHLLRIPLLKPVIAGSGDTVCRTADGYTVNGRPAAQTVISDDGDPLLPIWQECRALGDEIFVYSPAPHSFDSRYFGPVPIADIIGVYNPLWTF